MYTHTMSFSDITLQFILAIPNIEGAPSSSGEYIETPSISEVENTNSEIITSFITWINKLLSGGDNKVQNAV